MPPSRIRAEITTHEMDICPVELLLCNLSALICLRPRPGFLAFATTAPKNQKENSIRFPNAFVQPSFRSINLPECQNLLLQTNQLLKTEKGFSIKCDTYSSQNICLYAQTLLLATRREKTPSSNASNDAPARNFGKKFAPDRVFLRSSVTVVWYGDSCIIQRSWICGPGPGSYRMKYTLCIMYWPLENLTSSSYADAD